MEAAAEHGAGQGFNPRISIMCGAAGPFTPLPCSLLLKPPCNAVQAFDAARGLLYLHLRTPQIIHHGEAVGPWHLIGVGRHQ